MIWQGQKMASKLKVNINCGINSQKINTSLCNVAPFH